MKPLVDLTELRETLSRRFASDYADQCIEAAEDVFLNCESELGAPHHVGFWFPASLKKKLRQAAEDAGFRVRVTASKVVAAELGQPVSLMMMTKPIVATQITIEAALVPMEIQKDARAAHVAFVVTERTPPINVYGYQPATRAPADITCFGSPMLMQYFDHPGEGRVELLWKKT